MRAALAAHDEVLRSAIEAHDGWLFKHTGDGVCAAFGIRSRRRSTRRSRRSERWRLPVRMGLATGEASERDGDYFGPVLNRAARVMAAGHGGQVLVAASTAGVGGRASSWSISASTGSVTCRGRRVCSRCAPRAWRRTSRRCERWTRCPGNLPVQATSFVGRELEVRSSSSWCGPIGW